MLWIILHYLRCTSLSAIYTKSAHYIDAYHYDIQRRLRFADTAMLVVPSTRRSTLGDRALIPSGFGTCVEQPAVVCQCTVAEDCTFPVVV